MISIVNANRKYARMTTEVAILNKQGVALAADSIVTIGDRKKTYQTASKIYMLAEGHDVGILLYNGAEFMRVPWEIIISGYRQTLKHRQKFAHLEDYLNGFMGYVQTNLHQYLTEQQQEEYIHQMFQLLLASLWAALKENLDMLFPEGIESEEEVNSVFEQIVVESILRLDSFPDVDNGDGDSLFSRINESYREIIDRYIDSYSESMPITEEFKAKIAHFCVLVFSKANPLDLCTGIVFAGYGERDVFPKCMGVRTDLSICGCLRKFDDGMPVSISAMGTTAAINPYAQDDMIRGFLDGIHRSAMHHIIERISPHLNGSVIGGKSSQEFWQELYDEIAGSMSGDVIAAVSHLPKVELGQLAESLVKLQSMRQQVSMSIATVGGAIDVAVISKHDGFTWIQRKSYYDQDINLHLLKQ